MTQRTRTYLMVLVVTLAGTVACWYLLTQINHLPDDSEATTILPFRHKPATDIANNYLSLKVGQTLPVSKEFSIKLVSVNDSRCPSDPNIRCIWAGSISAKLAFFETGILQKTLEIPINKSAYFAGYQIQFLQVVPAQKKLATKILDYKITLKISNFSQ